VVEGVPDLTFTVSRNPVSALAYHVVDTVIRLLWGSEYLLAFG
jgi:hypothetical protein